MDMETLSWMVVGWFVVSIGISLVLGWFLREVNAAAEDPELDQVLSQRRVVRYLRGRRPAEKAGTESPRRDKTRRVTAG